MNSPRSSNAVPAAVPPWSPWLATAGGLIAGFGLAQLVVVLLETAARWSVGGVQFFGAALLAAVAFRIVHASRPSPIRRATRTALGTSAALLVGVSCVEWEGHAGGYYQNTQMRFALEELMRAQDQEWSRAGRYLGGLHSTLSSSLVDKVVLTPDGWAASARHPRSTRVCAVFVGSTPLAPAKVERRVRCSRGSLPPGPTLLALALILGGGVLGSASSWLRRPPLNERPG